MAPYGISAELSIPYDQAVQATREALKAQGFGVLTEIDVKETLREKLGVEFRRYVILGACNPPLAHRALQAETDIGLLLPCNVIVYEKDGGSVVSAMDPQMALGIVENPTLAPVAEEAAAKLRSAIDALRRTHQ
jgi:uncharacterized protein (DUF302 family)